MDPAANSLFLFCGRRRDRIKAILKEPAGFVLIYKRLTAPVFLWLSTAFWYNKGIENVYHCHGRIPVLKRFLDAYGKNMEFCQLQLNYLDWAFRFLQSIPGVTMILSGMSNQEQLEKNLATFSEDRKLNETKMQTILGIADKMLSVGTVPCTACHYCVSHCPMSLDIPHLLSLYNEHAYTGGGFVSPMALSALPPEKQPSACLQCRSCEQVCPQQIKISEVLADFSEKLG